MKTFVLNFSITIVLLSVIAFPNFVVSFHLKKSFTRGLQSSANKNIDDLSLSSPYSLKSSSIDIIRKGNIMASAIIGATIGSQLSNAIDVPITVKTNPTVFFELSVGGEAKGKVVFELYANVVPKTAENFRSLCTGETGIGFKGSKFHRIIPNFMCQGGDFTRGDGRGGLSIYGNKFADENFTVKHTKPGMLSMANSGPNTNGSQFFVTLVPCPWLDGKHVVFGEVKEGFDIIKMCEAVGSDSGRPLQSVVITNCGQIA